MAKDPYKYFRVEARELLDGLVAGVLALEKGGHGGELLSRLLRLAHTLKGAARVVKKPAIAELAHRAEGLLPTATSDHGEPNVQVCGEVLALLDQITELVRALDTESGLGGGGVHEKATALDDAIDTVRIEIQEMDALLRGITETSIHVGSLRRCTNSIDDLRGLTGGLIELLASAVGDMETNVNKLAARTRSMAQGLRSELERLARDFASNIEKVESGLAEIREGTQQLRLVAARTVFPALERTVRDAAQSLGRSVELEVSGGEVRLDAQVLAKLRDALMHVVRNAVAHGIEPAAERTLRGKSPVGKVRVTVERSGGRVKFSCRDDGRGVDLEAVRSAALVRQLIEPGDAACLDRAQVLDLLTIPGLTTATIETEHSGRGIGLDVVRTTATQLKGQLAITSESGVGTTIAVEVPISIASMQCLVVESSGIVVSIPLDAVERTMRAPIAAILRTGRIENIVHEDNLVPFVTLERAIGRTDLGRSSRMFWSGVILRAESQRVALGVDRILGTATIVFRTLPPSVAAEPVISGASINGDGRPQLVLNPNALLAIVESQDSQRSATLSPSLPPILIVDDSLTTRMLEKSILESAGYTVELAASAEEGLAKAMDRHYGLFVVDVEMPGMDGYSFLEATRSDPNLRDTPAIMVTSRDAADDRRRGELAGAGAYIVKGEFDQEYLLANIRRLIA